MKFGKTIQRRQLDLPEYQASFVDYKALKRLIKQLSVTPTLESHENAGAAASGSTRQAALQANKAAFFVKLDRQLEKVNECYTQKEDELKLRLGTLRERKRYIEARLTPTTKSTAEFVTLEGSYQQFSNDLNKLQQFVEINATAFAKILKKWDKSSKSRMKELYISRAVERQPCFNRELIADLSDRATADTLELADWAEGQRSETPSAPGIQPIQPTLEIADVETDRHLVDAAKVGNLDQLRESLGRLDRAGLGRLRATRAFYFAISEAPDQALQIFLESGILDFSYHDGVNSRNYLHEIAIYGRESILAHCLQGGTDSASQDVYGRTPLHYACTYGRTSMVEPLLDSSRLAIDQPDHDRYTPLVHAIAHNHVACVEQLISYGAKVEPSSEMEHIPLNLACQHGSVPIVRFLLDKSASILPDAEGLFPQHQVARSGLRPALLSILKDKGANLDEADKGNQWTPLFHASSEGHQEMINALLRLGVDVDKKDDKKLQALFYAAWEGHSGCMQVLSQYKEQSKDLPRPPPMQSTPVTLKTPRADPDAIPDLELPPPIIPMRRYGHNYLEHSSFVELTLGGAGVGAIKFFNQRKYPAARITVSSKSFDLIPRTLSLPLTEDSRTISFNVDDLANLNLDFDVYPTFGTKVMVKSIALASVFQNSAISRGRCSLPLFDPRLRAVGQIDLRFQIIHPLHGQSMEVTEFATYWKATSALDTQASTFITGSSLLGKYERMLLQITRDKTPVVHPESLLDVHPIQIPFRDINYAQYQQLQRHAIADSSIPQAEGQPTQGLFAEVLKATPLSTQIWLDISSPDYPLDLDINDYVDPILSTIFEQSRTRRQSAGEKKRSIILTSRSIEVCAALNWKQPNYPVLLNISASHSSGTSKLSFKEAVRVAQSNNLLGLICSAHLLDIVPALAHAIKEAGLVLIASDGNGQSRDVPSTSAPTASSAAVDGILSDSVIQFSESIEV